MSTRVVAVSDADGTLTYEIDYGAGKLREQLIVADYPTPEAVLARMEEREKLVVAEVANRVSKVVPDDIKAMVVADPIPDVVVTG